MFFLQKKKNVYIYVSQNKKNFTFIENKPQYRMTFSQKKKKNSKVKTIVQVIDME